MVHSDQPQQNGAAASGGSSSSAAAAAARPPKKQKQEKVPQRGLGVAELERILRDQQRGATASPPALTPAAASSWCHSTSRRAAAAPPPLPVTTAPTTISGACNLPMEPPSNQINTGNSYPLTSWPEDETACGMKRPWAFPFEHKPTGSSVLYRMPLFARSEELPSIHVLDPIRFESRSANVIRTGVPGFAEPDKKISNEDISPMKDGGFLTLGSSAPPAPAVSFNPKLKQPVVAIPPSMYRELPDFATWQRLQGSISENSRSTWRPFQEPFYEFFPTASSGQIDAKSGEQAKKTGDEIDLNLKL